MSSSLFGYVKLATSETALGSVIIRLDSENCPLTCENFRSLLSAPEGEKLSYRSTVVHRIMRSEFIAMGDVDFKIQNVGNNENSDVSIEKRGGASIYGKYFEDESFIGSHASSGVVSMCNHGPNTNSSQFFITLGDLSHLDGKHVIFGQVVKGMDVLRTLEEFPVDPCGFPLEVPVVVDCGMLSEDSEEMGQVIAFLNDSSPFDEEHGRPYPKFPQDCEDAVFVEEKLEISKKIRFAGNALYKSGDYTGAVEKYSKALNYCRDEFPTDEEEESMEEQRILCLLNRSAAFLKLGVFSNVIADCDVVLKSDPRNRKALFRKSKAVIDRASKTN